MLFDSPGCTIGGPINIGEPDFCSCTIPILMVKTAFGDYADAPATKGLEIVLIHQIPRFKLQSSLLHLVLHQIVEVGALDPAIPNPENIGPFDAALLLNFRNNPHWSPPIGSCTDGD